MPVLQPRVRTVDTRNATSLRLHNLLILKIKSYAMNVCPNMFRFHHRHNLIVQVVQISSAQGSSHPTVSECLHRNRLIDLERKKFEIL